jgi:hypothetical protein
MQVVFSSLPTLAVSAIYCVWYAYQKEMLLRDRTLRERRSECRKFLCGTRTYVKRDCQRTVGTTPRKSRVFA